MDSPQSIVSPFKGSSTFVEPEKQSSELFIKNRGGLSQGVSAHREEAAVCNLEDFIGVLDVYVHQARDIHNICIYHKQDVYAKLCLTSDPENAVSTQIINGGGQSPVFNENLRLKVRTIECSVKCEIWMMSRVRNYLEDQLLGFALVPLTEVLVKNGKLEKEFTLSSTDLFHSPAGYVQLSFSYSGTSPEVIVIPALPESVGTRASLLDAKATESLPNEFEKIEFPDPKIVNENHLMVSEYFGIPCTDLDSQSSDSLVSSDTANHLSPEVEVRVEENFPTGITNPNQYPKCDSPPSSVSTIESPSVLHPASSQSSEPSGESKSPVQEYTSECATVKRVNCGDAESNSSEIKPGSGFPKPVVDIEAEQKVVQQEIVDMYMKSMQQFTDSLAKMKLPLDIGNEPTSSGSSSSDQKLETPKSTGSRVFYGSRAFF
ncbi:uncharacterized protein [Nicotiana sylvestris]|uniref:Uncharacterized protein LOC104238253 n=1 Tax=Nicotiana sylvestris TaxID=4096 RepID=A0A1U7XMN1_NICSY|nr:PREDICTED: uncharacterized protein LOC104238253 [Nicotiana sylvestris]XP_009790871.1 PREDICTED: uncharacterized protein LOC104238253 [Nicotiana sylvestris]